MKTTYLLSIFFCMLLMTNPLLASTKPLADIEIRLNQVGYLNNESKVAVLLSSTDLSGQSFYVVHKNGRVAYTGKVSTDDRFANTFLAEFSPLTTTGSYRIEFQKSTSPEFQIGTGSELYLPVVDSLLRFFQVQQCGTSGGLYHGACHLHDATQIIPLSAGAPTTIDLTGGWHDAGDYTKFAITTAHTVYLLALAGELYPVIHSGKSGMKKSVWWEQLNVGTEWLLKLPYAPGRMIIQVSDQRDHDDGWRLPERDRLAKNRPAYDLPSKAITASVSAALAIASQSYSRAGEKVKSETCLRVAKELFELSNSSIPESSSGPDMMYQDQTSVDKRLLAAIELYRATNDRQYYDSACSLYVAYRPVHWISWGDAGTLALFRLADYEQRWHDALKHSLQYFQRISARDQWNYPIETYPWGSASLQAGVGALATLYEHANGETDFRSLASAQRDFLLGRNSHGVSLITTIGSEFPRQPHHQISYLKKLSLPGALVGGFTDRKLLQQNHIKLLDSDRFSRYQSSTVVYQDSKDDYLCNEPTIASNAQAVLLFAWFASQGRGSSSAKQ